MRDVEANRIPTRLSADEGLSKGTVAESNSLRFDLKIRTEDTPEYRTSDNVVAPIFLGVKALGPLPFILREDRREVFCAGGRRIQKGAPNVDFVAPSDGTGRWQSPQRGGETQYRGPLGGRAHGPK